MPKWPSLLLVVTLAVATGSGVGAVSQIAPAQAQARAPGPGRPNVRPPWRRLAPFPEPSEEVFGATANGRLYVFAGIAPGTGPKGLVYEYNPASNRWTAKRHMPLPSHHVAFVGYRDRIYAFGGFTRPPGGGAGWVPINNAWEYHPATDTWKALAPMPTRRGAAAAAVANGRIYVVGGATFTPGARSTTLMPRAPGRTLGTVEEYDPAANTWRSRSAMPTARNHLAVAAVNGKIYAIGGRVGAGFITLASNTDAVEAYDPASDRWTGVRARMPTPRSGLAWGVYKGHIIVAGGEFQDNRMLATYKAVEAFDPARNQWRILPSMPVPRHGLASGVIGDQLHLVSGDVQSAGTGLALATPEHDALALDRIRW